MGDLDGLGYGGTTVVVTGCSSGMGAATARILGDLGARVHAVDVKPPAVPHAAYYATDLGDPVQVAATVDALRAFGPIDFVFSCAGVSHTFGPMTCMRVNYIGARQLLEGLVPAMRDGGGIAIISSGAGMGWQANLAANLELLAVDDPVAAAEWCEARPEAVRDGYSVSKEMLIVWALQRCIALGEERGIRVNCIGPCPTDTAFMDDAVPGLPDGYFDRYPYPLLGRMATPEEQAWPLVLLNSPLNNVVTGTVLWTDQGFSGGAMTGALDISMMVPDDMG